MKKFKEMTMEQEFTFFLINCFASTIYNIITILKRSANPLVNHYLESQQTTPHHVKLQALIAILD